MPAQAKATDTERALLERSAEFEEEKKKLRQSEEEKRAVERGGAELRNSLEVWHLESHTTAPSH